MDLVRKANAVNQMVIMREHGMRCNLVKESMELQVQYDTRFPLAPQITRYVDQRMQEISQSN